MTYPFRNAQDTLILDTTELDLLDDLMMENALDSTTYVTLCDEDILSEHDKVQKSLSEVASSTAATETELNDVLLVSMSEMINGSANIAEDPTTSNANVDNEQTDDADSQQKNSTLNTGFLGE